MSACTEEEFIERKICPSCAALGIEGLDKHSLGTKKLPSEVELPVEPAPGHVRGGDVLERVVGDDVDDRAHDSFPGNLSV